MNVKGANGFASRGARVLLSAVAAVGLAFAANGDLVTAADGASVTIGTDVDNSKNSELSVTSGVNGVTIVLPAADDYGISTVWTRIYLQGTGTVAFAAAEGETPKSIVIAGGLAADDDVTLHVAATNVTMLGVGAVNVANVGDKLHYPVADIANVTFANSAGEFVLRGYCTARKVPDAFRVAAGAEVALQGENPLHFGNAFTLTDYDLLLLTADAVPSSCTVMVPPGRTLYVKPCDPTKSNYVAYPWLWTGVATNSGIFPVVLNGKGARVVCRNVNSARLTLLLNISGTGEVLFQSDSTETEAQLIYHGMTYRSTKGNPVAIPINTSAEPVTEATHSWTNKVAHWFDASDASTVIRYARSGKPDTLRYEFEGLYPVVCGWTDHVKGTTDKFLFSRDAFNGCYPYYLPYVVEGGLNGKDYLSFGKYYHKIDMTTVDTLDCPSDKHINRWLQFVKASSTDATGTGKPSGGYTTLTGCKYCIMVFGSQFGGGKSILGDQNDDGSPRTTGNMARGDSLISQNWFAYEGYSIMVDGMPADTTDKPSGGWQIVSLDMSATNTVLDCLGGHFVTKRSDSALMNGRNFTMAGGQNYAEILFFDEVPTAAERAACERYLAEKWGLPCAEWDVGFTELSGGGPVSLTDERNTDRTGVEEVTVAGNYFGTLTVPEGKTLVVSDRPAPPSVYDIPQQESLVAWFDPSIDGAIDFNESGSAPTGVARLYSRNASGVDKADGAYWLGMQHNDGITSPYGRFPFLVETSYLSAAGIGAPISWLDYTQNISGDTLGNTLRSHVMPDQSVTQTGATKMTFRSLFMALDTSAGGGNPVLDEVTMSGAFKPRESYGSDYTKPIWSSDNTVTMAHTWLDTNEVNGVTAGYNGRAEVLGFETSTDFTTHRGLFLGYYNKDRNKGVCNYEHIGETLIYSTTLTETERIAVQEYLMAKWTGDLNGKYTDLSRATVTGAGNVYSASLRNLPTFDSGFTGELSGGSNMTFTVDSSWNASAAVDAVTVDRAVTVDSACAVKVTLKGEANAGNYSLLTVPSGALAGKTFTLSLVNETEKPASARLNVSDTVLSLEILSQGTLLLVR